MFNKMFNLELLNNSSKNTLMEHIGIEYTEIGKDYLKGKMPVDDRTVQPLRMLHGGASVVLAESLGSLGALMTLDPSKQYGVGVEINANHIKSAENGFVEGIARPLHIGKKTQVWETKITNQKNELVCVSRMTIAIMDKKE
jgi:1,4-dihydroxy-2-naphthoyl-CoA hydrolase